MKRELKEIAVRGIPKITATLKWWRGMSRYRRFDSGFRARISHAKFMADQRRMERIYNLQSGETLGI